MQRVSLGAEAYLCLHSSTTTSGEGLVLAQSSHLKAQSDFKVTFPGCANRSQILSYSLVPTHHLSDTDKELD
ncbi:MAG: hypothetical protein HN867_12605 [Deltaproteobacteria bacterium]|nr:hypothetical protein [Deltaproteobacteria bacterium]